MTLKCDHKKTKMKLVACASGSRLGHIQYFKMKECCALCGAVISKSVQFKPKEYSV